MTGAASRGALDAEAGAGAGAAAVARASNARRSASSASSASGRPSAALALRASSPALPGSRSIARCASARSWSSRSRSDIALVHDLEALAAGGDRRAGGILGGGRVELGRDADDRVLLAGLGRRVARDLEQPVVRLGVAPLGLAGDLGDHPLLEIGEAVLARAD